MLGLKDPVSFNITVMSVVIEFQCVSSVCLSRLLLPQAFTLCLLVVAVILLVPICSEGTGQDKTWGYRL